eukprot:gene61-biopygen7719
MELPPLGSGDMEGEDEPPAGDIVGDAVNTAGNAVDGADVMEKGASVGVAELPPCGSGGIEGDEEPPAGDKVGRVEDTAGEDVGDAVGLRGLCVGEPTDIYSTLRGAFVGIANGLAEGADVIAIGMEEPPVGPALGGEEDTTGRDDGDTVGCRGLCVGEPAASGDFVGAVIGSAEGGDVLSTGAAVGGSDPPIGRLVGDEEPTAGAAVGVALPGACSRNVGRPRQAPQPPEPPEPPQPW